jgi:ABC-type transport system involved in multi-copper enzyme maturation permease subunit
MAGTLTVAEKEMKDQVGSKRFLILFGFMILLSGLAAYQGVDFIKNNSEATFVFIFSGAVFSFSFIQTMVMFGPILGMAFGFDAINKERTTGTLSVLLGQPIYRDSVINGKFLAGAAALATLGLGTIAWGNLVILEFLVEFGNAFLSHRKEDLDINISFNCYLDVFRNNTINSRKCDSWGSISFAWRVPVWWWTRRNGWTKRRPQ